MDAVTEFLAMGGYAPYVWGAYGLTAVVVIGLVAGSLAQRRSAARTLAALERLRPKRRKPAGDGDAPPAGTPT